MTAEEGKGSRTILLVERDKDARRAMSEFLSAAGYTVIAAAEGMDAFDKLKERDIDLVIVDLIVQRKTGAQMRREMSRRKPGMKTLFVSRYPVKFIREEGDKTSGLNILEKPFLPSELLRSVQAALDA